MDRIKQQLILIGIGVATVAAFGSAAHADEKAFFIGARAGWVNLDGNRTADFANNSFGVRSGMRTFTPGIELGAQLNDNFAFRAYYDHVDAEYTGTQRTKRGYMAGGDMLLGYSRGFFAGVGLNYTELGNQSGVGTRATLGYRHNYSSRLSNRLEVAYQNSSSPQRGTSDLALTYVIQFNFGSSSRLTATPAPYSRQAQPADIPDSDGDGVPDYLDLCPNTPASHIVDQYGCSRFQTVSERVQLNISFPMNSAEIPPRYLSEIEAIATQFKQQPNQLLRIEGHTDSSGSRELNFELSQRRADAVKRVLVEQFGIDPNSIVSEGFADTRPIVFGDEANPRNRRVEAVFSIDRRRPVN